jgi:hypothetical protein
VVGDEDTFTFGIVLRSTSTTQHLQDIERSKFAPSTFLRIVDLRAFDDDSMGWQIDTLILIKNR